MKWKKFYFDKKFANSKFDWRFVWSESDTSIMKNFKGTCI